MFNEPISISIKSKINYFRSFSSEELIAYFNNRNSEYDFDSGYYAEVFISKNENLVIKILTTNDPAYIIWANICINKYKNNPLFPHIYLIDDNVIYMEKLESWEFDAIRHGDLQRSLCYFRDIGIVKAPDNNHKEVGKILLPLFEKYTFDVHTSNMLARYSDGQYTPVITDPICNKEDGETYYTL